MMATNQASAYQQQQKGRQNPLPPSGSSGYQIPQNFQTQNMQQNHLNPQGHPIITYGVQQNSQQPYPYNNTFPGGYLDTLGYGYAYQHYQTRMWPLVRRIFPTEEGLLKSIFTVHLIFLVFFVLNRDVLVNNAYLLVYNAFFIHFLFVLFILTLLWALLRPLEYHSLDVGQLTQIVATGADSFVLFKLITRYSADENVEKYFFWCFLLLCRLLTILLLRKLSADRWAAAIELSYGLNPVTQNTGPQGAYQLTPAIRTSHKQMSPPPNLSSSQRHPVNFTVGGGSVRGDNPNSRDAYLYEQSLNA